MTISRIDKAKVEAILNPHVPKQMKPDYNFNGGPKHKIKTPAELLEKFAGYVNYNRANPIIKKKEKMTRFGLEVTTERCKKPLTLKGFQIYGDFSQTVWDGFYYRDEFDEAVAYIKDYIYEDKYGGAAVGTYNASVIMRDLGLSDNLNVNGSSLPPPPPQTDPVDVPNLVHPDDPDPYAPGRMLFSQRQLEAGVQYPHPQKTINGEAG